MCYLRLGLLRDAEKQLLSSVKEQPMLISSVLLAKVRASVGVAVCCLPADQRWVLGVRAWLSRSYRLGLLSSVTPAESPPATLPRPPPPPPPSSAAAAFDAAHMCKPRQVYIRMDQPQSAIACYEEGLSHFPDSTTLRASTCQPITRSPTPAPTTQRPLVGRRTHTHRNHSVMIYNICLLYDTTM